MSEKEINAFFIGLWYWLILIVFPIVVFFVSIWLTSRLRSVLIRVLSSILFSGSIFLFFFLLQWGWILRGGWGPGNPDDMYVLPKPNPMQEFLQLAVPLFLFCAVIFSAGLGLCWISSRVQKKRQTN